VRSISGSDPALPDPSVKAMDMELLFHEPGRAVGLPERLHRKMAFSPDGGKPGGAGADLSTRKVPATGVGIG